MASKRAQRRKQQQKQCGSKHRFESKDQANKALGKIFQTLEYPMRSYFCKFCQAWHFGHFTNIRNFNKKS